MKRLNRDAARLARQHQAHAVTDITGYGLLGHGHEMAHLSGVDFHLHSQALNWLPGARKYAEQDVFPGGMWRNKDYFEQWVRFDDRVPEALQYLLFDPETSGGLLIAVAAAQADELCADLLAAGDQAQLIGDVLPGGGGLRVSFD